MPADCGAGSSCALWLRDHAHLYELVTRDLAELGVGAVTTVLVGQAIVRAGVRLAGGAEAGGG